MSRYTFQPEALHAFAKTWPCSGMGDALGPLTFEFAENGDLVDIIGECDGYDGGAMLALSHDAQAMLRAEAA